MTCLFYTQIIFNKAKKLEFESEVGQKTNVYEIIFAVILVTAIFLPAFHELFNIFDEVTFLTNIVNGIFKINNIMLYISILEFIGLVALIAIEIKHRIELKQASSTDTKKVI